MAPGRAPPSVSAMRAVEGSDASVGADAAGPSFDRPAAVAVASETDAEEMPWPGPESAAGASDDASSAPAAAVVPPASFGAGAPVPTDGGVRPAAQARTP